MRSIALALATFLVFTVATVAPLRAQEVEIEEAPADEDLSDLGARPKGPQEPAIQYGVSGPYAIVAGTYAAEDFKNLKNDVEDVVGEGVDFENSLGLNLRAGYRWHPNLSAEAEFEWLNSFDMDDDPGGVGEVWSLTANQKAFLSTGRFQLFLLFGLGLYDVRDAEAAGSEQEPQGTGFGLKGGAGFNFYITEHLGLNTDVAYNWGTGGVNELRYTSFSWGLIFNP